MAKSRVIEAIAEEVIVRREASYSCIKYGDGYGDANYGDQSYGQGPAG